MGHCKFQIPIGGHVKHDEMTFFLVLLVLFSIVCQSDNSSYAQREMRVVKVVVTH